MCGNVANATISMEDHKIFSKFNSLKLIRLVRNYEILYNSNADGYTDKIQKEFIWEDIHRSIFPQYDQLSDGFKEMIRTNVRRRWKSLRNAIAREVKKNATVENYMRKKESPLLSELEFLIPHIKSSYCAKLTNELGLRDMYTFMADADDLDHQEDEDLNDLVDLTEDYDIKPNIKFDHDALDNSSDDIIYPIAQLTSSEKSTHAHSHGDSTDGPEQRVAPPQFNWSSEFCTVAEYKGGEFTNSTVLSTSPDVPDNTGDELKTSQSETETRKRPRLEAEDTTELQRRILQLLSNLERRDRCESRTEVDPEDEDRMFLLSLVSDLKRVPATKKMLVKAEIATLIARAAQGDRT